MLFRGLCSVSHSESSISHKFVERSLLLAYTPNSECRSSVSVCNNYYLEIVKFISANLKW